MTDELDPLDAWAAYWQSPEGRQGGCLPGQNNLIAQVQKQVWQHLAGVLPPGAAVLDLATGNAIVLRWIAEVRSDLMLTGVDQAQILPPPPAGVQVFAGIPVSQLPFENGSFSAVTSQFGVEYCDLESALFEAGRVLTEGGRAVFLTHRLDSPLLIHNRARADALEWILDRMEALEGVNAFTSAAEEATSYFGAPNPAWEIAEALRRAGRGATNLKPKLNRLASYELARIRSLEVACERADETASWKRAAASAQLEEVELIDLAEAPGRPPFGRLRVFFRD